ncbi:Protein of unknown function [Roseateles sp. YR242]|uniref:DUF3606 domain-containing protein n=1 Tax=Roseateles sp. YR242 TaxID=1855305 RepID=UPI0008BFAA17|nr:DUF3606 domain-containing protein [Roseateles sp. YR242]SEL65893.1 Protein of unknown function [Roseateles sp. YR242]
MPDDTTTAGSHGADHHRVSINEDYELRYWGERFGVSNELLKRAVDEVGTSAQRVEQWLQAYR